MRQQHPKLIDDFAIWIFSDGKCLICKQGPEKLA